MKCSLSSQNNDKKRKSDNTEEQHESLEGPELLFEVVATCGVCGVLHRSDAHAHEFDYVENDDYHRDNDLLDSFTLEPLFEPMQLPCGHMFSFHRGIQRKLIDKKKCPMNCSSTITIANFIQPALMVKNTLNKLKVIKTK
jgi:hypothetical protein